MPPSQLKQLKASLRDNGVLGPQQSKKQKKQNVKSGASAQNRNQREAALQAIRDRFNPFEVKATTKNAKFDYTSRDGGANASKTTARPGVTKSLGEERRRATLLREMDRKNKVGGILDRRFGENDPTMTPEERAAERFARESQKKARKESMFNLEDEDEGDFTLTHMGQSLSFDGEPHVDNEPQDDFEDNDMGSEDGLSDSETPRKRKRVFAEGEVVVDGAEDGENLPERKKSKQEVMKEVIAKSKFHKAERQQAKEDDADLREELDKGLPDLFDMLRSVKPPPKPEPPKDDFSSMNPERAAVLEGISQQNYEKEYDQRLKQLTFDKRSQPTDRTKTAEEKIAEEAERLKKLEEDRVRRMRGEQPSESEDEEEEQSEDEDSDEESIPDDAKAFGLQQPTNEIHTRPELGVEDEDDFILDDDLVETRSDASLEIGDSDIEGFEEESEEEEEEEDELINGLTFPGGGSGQASAPADSAEANEKLAYTYPCPEDHESFLHTIKDVPVTDIPTVVQRIRALHHPRLHSDNKRKLGRFAEVLTQHVSYMAEQPENPPFAILENIIRHIHSLAKSHPENVNMAFRARLRKMATERPLKLSPSDLVILTAIAAIFPTSDHFHAIVTPAHLCIARYMGQGVINSLSDFATGAYAASLFLQYQTIAKRYMPEFINYILNALYNLSPQEPKKPLGFFPIRKPEQSVALTSKSKKATPRKLRFWDIIGPESGKEEELKLSLLTTFITLLSTASDLWIGQSAYTEIFEPAQATLNHLCKFTTSSAPSIRDTLQSTLDKLSTNLSNSHLSRRPLFLHNHKPLAIKTAIPKFEESFNPDKHYDPDRERAEANRLRTEYKRERKGALRELRKDANFVAREQLREKKEKDAEYEKKYKKLVAEVQNEEGRAANEYEREKRARQGKS
ncbi:snoRNA-binding rRNA-processing protein NOP14 [Aspergillus ruber CBS 135680]|uniref:Putative rRNA maturation protein n=1 Tax=Aspergillus ruber (strain CBS 135680) TaxID=1388766 RepID=A0A017SGQ4_ASPRC|nr:putative rRNA maturation protein [Aspergillus ruber CBS 135680]EYE95936.1 putative rRNA maturation protein [Aspergillus ruber CBS 135680]